jgi:hypothetical protein
MGEQWFECRAISLTRDVPFGLGWAIEPEGQAPPLDLVLSVTSRSGLLIQFFCAFCK